MDLLSPANRILRLGYYGRNLVNSASRMIVIYIRNINNHQLRDTAFVLWFILAYVKMTAFTEF